MSARAFVLSVFLLLPQVCFLNAQNAASAVEAPAFFDIRPGKSTVAEADMRFGEAMEKLPANADGYAMVYRYQPPPEAPEAARLEICYFGDSLQVARLDVYLKVPISAQVMREQFGTRVVTRDRANQTWEEVYYPRLQALLLVGAKDDPRVSAISYLSPRYLAQYYANRSRQLIDAKRGDEARIAAEKAVFIAPEMAAGYVAQGIYFWDTNNFPEAKVRFVAAAGAAGAHDRAMAHLWLAHFATERDKNPDEATKQYRQAIAENPSFADAHFRFGRFLHDQKNMKEAAPELRRAAELDANNIDARYYLVNAVTEQKLWDELFAQLRYLKEKVEAGVITDPVNKGKIFRRYAEALWPGRGDPNRRSFGKPDEALTYYDKAAMADVHDTWAYYNMGDLYCELGQPAKAVESFRRGVARNPKSWELQRGLGLALLESGRYAEARRVAEDSIVLDAKLASVQMVQVARAACAMRDKKGALQWLRKAADAGYVDRAYLSSDSYFAPLRDNGDFKKILARMQ